MDKYKTKANQVSFTTIEMELMFRENQRANKDLEDKLNVLSETEKAQNGFIRSHKFETLEQYIEFTMAAFAEASYGDIVLTEGGKELKRVKANYKQREIFKNPESK